MFDRIRYLALVVCCALTATARGQTVTCSSDDGKRHHCNADTQTGMHLVKQRSGSACMRGVSWDIDGSGVWVDHGCRADFAPGETDPDRDRDNGGSGTLVSCGSDDMHRHYCSAENTRAGVRMVKQRSASPCRQDYSWGFDDHGIWVDHGCRADFATETGPPAEESCLQSVGQARAHALVNQCIQVSPATHPPCNVQNPCSLIRDEIQRSCALLKNQGAPAFCRDYH